MQQNRRDFLKWSSLFGGLALTPMQLSSNLLKTSPMVIKWAGCNVNCGTKCPIKVHTQDGIIKYVSTDNEGKDEFDTRQARACVRGRSSRYKVYNANRLKRPLKRVGKRGEGKFMPISWEQAFDEIALKMKETKDKYGNEAFFITYATGSYGSLLGNCYGSLSPFARLLSLYGGYLNYHNSYSTAQITNAMNYFYGGSPASDIATLRSAKLAIFFGANHVETRMGGGGIGYAYHKALEESNCKIIHIDPRYNDSCIGHCDEWIPIAPGTDAALIAALAYVMIKENLLDRKFLDTYTIGFSESTLPSDAPKNSSYESYVLGICDGIEKTPEWASKITKIPSRRIIQLAREIALTKPCFIEQGWGVQRHSNGEQNARAIATLACMIGSIGIEGGNTGCRTGTSIYYDLMTIPCKNPIKDSIPCFLYTDAIYRGKEMTDLSDGVRGTKQLKQNIKFIFNISGNCLTNQHSTIKEVNRILSDESLCECIVDINVTRTPSNNYADYILPDATTLEQEDFILPSAGYYSNRPYIIYCQKAIEPVGEAKPIYEMCIELAKRLGIEQEFSEGKTQKDWLKYLYEESMKKNPLLPNFEEMREKGLVKFNPVKPVVALEDFIKDPINHPLKTPSGKIEIYSNELAKMQKTWKLREGQQIVPIPVFESQREGILDPLKEKYPLQFYGYHYKGRTHSSFWEIPQIRETNPQEIWINPIDAQARGIKTGDIIQVRNDLGIIQGMAKVTPKIIPGCAVTPQGSWAKYENGIDMGTCVNSLASIVPTAISKGNGQHSILVEIAKV
ncbi:DMSO/selenate family reductase complex A subunit [Campylobacter molothri]|uniref:DMSO/selenate family reductase complex A subunit n=1 Tax=Campylobacter molothri TaxID=1032242 RepID=UPI001EFC0B3B|nr:DMSO/selenate family reductase complex A subunit [Campylobacter sp. RM10537]ULO00544.1 anaerobic DMSO reductase DmsABC, chain A [Campylobacter sp. RM10537]